MPVVAGVGGQGFQGDDQAGPSAGGAQPPGAVPAGRPVPAGRGEREPGVPGRAGSGAFPVTLGFGAGAAVPDRVPVLVGDRHAPGRLGVPRGRGGEVAGQPRVDRADPAELAGPVRQAGHGGQRHGQGHPPGEPGRRRAARRPGRRRRRARAARPRPARRPPGPGPSGPGPVPSPPPRCPGGDASPCPAAGPGTRGRGARPCRPPGPALLQLPGPGGDPLVRGQHLIRGQLAAHQRGVTRILGPPLHPRVLRRGLPALLRRLGGDLHHRCERWRRAARPGSAARPGPGPCPRRRGPRRHRAGRWRGR